MGLQPRTAGVAATQGLFLGLTYMFVIARLLIRKFLVKRISWDDYFLILAQALFTVYSSTAFVAIKNDFSRPVNYTQLLASLHEISLGLKYWWLSEIFYALTCIFLRISVGVLLARIASTKAQVRVIYTILAVMICASLGFIFTVIFECNPVQYYWTQWVFAKGTCVKSFVIADAAYAHAAVSFVADWILGLLPIWLLWMVQISKERKVGISVLLGMGMLCGAVALVRIPYIKRLEDTKHFITDWIAIALTSIIEPGIGIIAASLAAFRPLFHTLRFQSLYSRLLSSRLSWSKSKRSSATQTTTDSSAMAEEGRKPIIHKATSFSVENSPARREKFEEVDLS